MSKSNNPVIEFEKGTPVWNLIGLCLIEMAKPAMKSKFINHPTFQKEIYEIWFKFFRPLGCRKMTFDEFTSIWSSYRKLYSRKGDFYIGSVPCSVDHHVLNLDVFLYRKDDGNTSILLSTVGSTEEFLKHECKDLYSILERIEKFADTELDLYCKDKGYLFDNNDDLPF